MSKVAAYAKVEVAVVVILRGKQVLLVNNPRWASFTLPMTKRRRWKEPRAPKSERVEPWVEAAARAAAECLGRTLTEKFELVVDSQGYWHGDATGEVKEYHYQVFEVRVASGTKVLPGIVSEWLGPADILDTNRHPISHTARYLMGKRK